VDATQRTTFQSHSRTFQDRSKSPSASARSGAQNRSIDLVPFPNNLFVRCVNT
jgi:hypothetical protein